MKFAYSIKQKAKIALLLFCILVCSVLIRFLEDRSVKKMNRSFTSMFNDRLMPAIYLFKVTENVHAKNELIEEKLNAADKCCGAETAKAVNIANGRIDSLVHIYEQTYLVEKEKTQLIILKHTLARNRKLEEQAIAAFTSGDAAKALKLYNNSVEPSNEETVTELSQLMAIQEQVGKELIEDYDFFVSGTKVYSALQTALAIVIGLLIVGLIFTTRVAAMKNDKFRLN